MILKPTNQRIFKKKIFGFDIETYNRNKSFYCVSIVGENYEKVFLNKQTFINEIKHKRFRNSILVASNLLFDFFGIFFGNDTVSKFETLFRGSDLLLAKTYIRGNAFHRTGLKTNRNNLLFLDTLNYARMTVEKLGNILNIPKLKKPSFLGKKPINKKQHDELIKYNIRDSEISRKGLLFLYKAFQDLGANPKNTIASTSLSAWRNKYQNENYFNHDKSILMEIFNSYYGGRTEAFMRGKIEDINYYDINSLYPYVMKKYKYPHPNYQRCNRINSLDYIHNYEGFAYVEIISPKYMLYPFLPLRTTEKLLFPLGTLKGYYTNVELREALKYGYKIKRVFKNIYFKETCSPFKDFVDDLYSKRMFYKSINSPMEMVTKILMNSLYGKFGQRFDNKENWVPIPDEHEEFIKYNVLDIKGSYMRVKADAKPSVYCFPEWSSYVSAYGRIELFNLINQCHPLYVDTDSIMTTKKMVTGNELGKLKLEMRIDEGVIIKPKLYCIKGRKGSFVKAKGIGLKFVYNNFLLNFIDNPKVNYKKFIKFKEALRRNLIPNEIIDMTKKLDLEDNKRIWQKPFNRFELQGSSPIDISENTNLYKLPEIIG